MGIETAWTTPVSLRVGAVGTTPVSLRIETTHVSLRVRLLGRPLCSGDCSTMDVYGNYSTFAPTSSLDALSRWVLCVSIYIYMCV